MTPIGVLMYLSVEPGLTAEEVARQTGLNRDQATGHLCLLCFAGLAEDTVGMWTLTLHARRLVFGWGLS